MQLSNNPSLKELQDYVKQAALKRGFDDETIAQKFMLLSEEIGELAKAARKDAGIKTADGEQRHVDLEAADVLFVFVNICNKLDISLEQAFSAKETINDSRQWK